MIVVGLLLGNVAMMVVLIVASSSNRPEIIPQYYDRAVAYDTELDEAAHSREIGWQATATLANDGITVEVVDRSGGPIADARVAVSGFQRAHAAEALDLALVPTDGGYRARRDLRAGVYDLKIKVERDGSTFVARQTVELR